MKILAIGDVVSPPGMEALRRLLRPAKKRYAADFIIVNGENCSGVGLTPRQAEELFDAGAISSPWAITPSNGRRSPRCWMRPTASSARPTSRPRRRGGVGPSMTWAGPGCW